MFEATKAAGACRAALLKPTPPRETGSEVRTHLGSDVEMDAPVMLDKARHCTSSKDAKTSMLHVIDPTLLVLVLVVLPLLRVYRQHEPVFSRHESSLAMGDLDYD